MPRPTFFALPDDKRDRVTRAAVAEFSASPYGTASLDRVASMAKVSKGSLYQYFDDKLDLYRWLILEHLPARKKAAAPPHARPYGDDGGDVFDWLAAAFITGVALFRTDAALAALAARAAFPVGDNDAAAVHREVRRKTHDGLTALLGEAQAHGVVRNDVSLDLAAELTAALIGPGLLSTLAHRAGLDDDGLLKAPERLATVPDEDVHTLLGEAIAALRRAIAQPIENAQPEGQPQASSE